MSDEKLAFFSDVGGVQTMPVPWNHWGAAGMRDLGAQNSGGGAPSHLPRSEGMSEGMSDHKKNKYRRIDDRKG